MLINWGVIAAATTLVLHVRMLSCSFLQTAAMIISHFVLCMCKKWCTLRKKTLLHVHENPINIRDRSSLQITCSKQEMAFAYCVIGENCKQEIILK